MEDHEPFPLISAYEFVLELRAAFRFRQELPATIELLFPDDRRLILEMKSKYDQRGLPHPILEARAQVTGSSLEDAGTWLVDFARNYCNSLGVAMNSYTEDVQVLYGIDISEPHQGSRRFVQAQSQIQMQAVPSRTRLLDHEAAITFATAIYRASDASTHSRLLRAIQQYIFALRYWNLEQQVMSCAHAYMAVEALTPIAKRSLGIDDVALAKEEVKAGHIKYLRRNRDASNAADTRARRLVIFHNDSIVARKARKLSDGFEHGYEDYETLRLIAREYAGQIMNHVRHAIIELAAVPEPAKSALLSVQFSEPMPLFSMNAVFGRFPDDTANDYHTPPLDLTNSEATIKSYDPTTGLYVLDMSRKVIVTGSKVVVDETKTRF